MGTFYNLKYDAVFKKVVGNEEDTRFINKILSNILERKIEVIEFIRTELPKEYKNQKNNILDLLVKTKDNKIIDIEVNSNYDQIIRERNLIYYCTIYGMYTRNEYMVSEKILIDLVYNGGKNTPKKDIGYIIYEKTGKLFSRRFKIITVNIRKYKEEWERNISKRNDKYIVALDASKEELEELSKKDEIIKEVKEKVFRYNEDGTITRMISIEEENKLMQEARERIAKEKGERRGISIGKKEGKEEGILIGKKEGIKEGTRIIIKNLLKYMEVEEIHRITNVPIEEIEAIKKELNK